MHETGATINSSGVTNVIAPVMYAVRTAVFQKSLNDRHGSPTSGSPSVNAFDAVKRYQKYLKDQQETPMSFAYNASKLLSKIRQAEYHISEFEFTDPLGRELSYKGDLITLASLKALVEGQQDLYLQKLKDLMFFGEEIPPWIFPSIDIDSLVEDVQCRKPGYSFLDDTRNNLSIHQYHYGAWIIDRHHKEFFYHVGNKIVLRPDKCADLLYRMEVCDRYLAAGLIFSSGPSARATEFSRYIMCDLPGVPRNLGIVNHNISLNSTQDKTSHQRRRDLYIPHVPTRDWQRLLLQNLTVFRPFARHIVNQLYSPNSDIAIRYRHYLWPGLKGHMDSEVLGDYMAESSKIFTGVAMRIRLWRGLTTVIFSRHADSNTVHTQLENYYDTANMHSSSTAERLYGGNTGLGSGGSARTVDGCFKVAQTWHRLLDIGTADPIGGDIETLVNSRASVGGGECSFNLMALETRLAQMEERNAKSLQSTVIDTIADASRVFFPPPPVPSSISSLAPVSDIAVHPSRLRHLREFMDDSDASFTCPQQGVLLEHILDGKQNILGVLATGFGKTTLIMMISKMYASTKTIVMVLPLLALHENVHERARNFGLATEQWKPGPECNRVANIVTVGIEMIGIKQFHE